MWCVLIDRIKPISSDVVFDIGCGPGQFAAYLRDAGLGRYIGLDFSKETIRMAKLTCPEFEFANADVFASNLFLEFPYGIVVCTEFLEHIEKDQEVLQRIRSGTRVYGSVPNFPDPGHVRCFKNCDEVHMRYSKLFHNFKVDGFRADAGEKMFFLFEGIRN